MPTFTESSKVSDETSPDLEVSLGIDLFIITENRQKLLSSSPTATIWLHGVGAEGILDTGAQILLISYQFYHMYLARKVGKLDRVGTFVKLVGAKYL